MSGVVLYLVIVLCTISVIATLRYIATLLELIERRLAALSGSAESKGDGNG